MPGICTSIRIRITDPCRQAAADLHHRAADFGQEVRFGRRLDQGQVAGAQHLQRLVQALQFGIGPPALGHVDLHAHQARGPATAIALGHPPEHMEPAMRAIRHPFAGLVFITRADAASDRVGGDPDHARPVVGVHPLDPVVVMNRLGVGIVPQHREVGGGGKPAAGHQIHVPHADRRCVGGDRDASSQLAGAALFVGNAQPRSRPRRARGSTASAGSR
jgi:hypothetical protein